MERETAPTWKNLDKFQIIRALFLTI